MTDKRLTWSKIAISGFFLAAAISQAKLQIVEREHTIELANETKRYELSRPDFAQRGSIFSADGVVLAKDDPVYDLEVDFRKCPSVEGFWLDLAAATGIPATDFSAMAAAGAKGRIWPHSVSEAQREELDAVRARWRAGGVSAVATGRRSYPLGASTSCLVGVIRHDGLVVGPGDKQWQWALKKYGHPKKGKMIVADLITGLESSEDKDLRGKNGVRTGVTDRNGQFLPMRAEEGTHKADGQNVVLTLDSDLQTLAAESIKRAVTDNNAESGVALVMEPKTGNLLAMANWPSFDPYTLDGSYGPMGDHGSTNPATMSCLEPGSMFKILTLAKALDEGVVHMTDTFNCPGEKEVVRGAKPIRCDLHHGNRAHGRIDPIMAIARSCNIWAAIWAKDMGYDKFVPFLDSIDLFKKPDLGLAGSTGLFNRNDPAKALQVANVGFGQSINCTPVALIGAFSALANQGTYQPPRLIDRIGQRQMPLKRGRKVLSTKACDEVIQGMIAVFGPRGTGATLKIPGYELAGKTGTAQKIGRTESGNVSNFVGFIPARSPRAVVLVMVNKPQKGQVYGAEVAGPVFDDLAKALIRRYNLPGEALPAVHAKTAPATTAGSDPISVPSRPPKARSTVRAHDA